MNHPPGGRVARSLGRVGGVSLWPVTGPRPSTASDLLAALPDAVPRALLAAALGAMLESLADAFALRLLHPATFTSYLVIFVLADLLLAVFAVAPRLAAVRVLAPAICAGSDLDVVRVALGVRRLWSVVQRRVAIALLAVFLAGVLVLGFDVRTAGVSALVFAVFAVAGRLHLEGGLVAGLIRPVWALVTVSVVPPAAAIVLLLLLAVSPLGASPAVVSGVRLCALAAGLLTARAIIAACAPIVGVGTRVAGDRQPLPCPAFWTWTVASLAERSVIVVPLLAVLTVVSDPVLGAAYAMAWRASSIVDAGVVVHAVVRPAVAAASAPSPGPIRDLRSPSARAAAAALWWTLFAGVLLAGPLVAGGAVLAVLFGLPAEPFRSYLRWFVVGRLGVVAAGPGAEVLEVGGQHVARCRAAVAIALPAVALAVGFAAADRVGSAAVVAIGSRFAIEAAQSWIAWSALRVDCTVCGVLRHRDVA